MVEEASKPFLGKISRVNQMQRRTEMRYYADLDEKNKPVVLFRATPDMEEQVWMPDQGGWKLSEFLLDVLEGWGDTYPISEEMARKHFPKEAFD